MRSLYQKITSQDEQKCNNSRNKSSGQQPDIFNCKFNLTKFPFDQKGLANQYKTLKGDAISNKVLQLQQLNFQEQQPRSQVSPSRAGFFWGGCQFLRGCKAVLVSCGALGFASQAV